MTLVYDAGFSGPAAHALVIAVGTYSHSPIALPDISSPRVSAQAFAHWMREEYTNPAKPLGSIDLLISPERGTTLGVIGSHVEAATMQNIGRAFDGWVERCDSDEGNIAVFYFC